MTDPEKRELARKATVLYDGIGMLMGHLQQTGRMTKAEQELGVGIWRAWRHLMFTLDQTTDDAIDGLRGGGDFPKDMRAIADGWLNFLKGLQ